MSETTEGLRRKMSAAAELQSVVRTMKAVAASSIGQYESSVRALADYSRAVELGLSACFRRVRTPASSEAEQGSRPPGPVGAVVFGSDQGLVGQFNDLIADAAIDALRPLDGAPRLWAVGERVHARLTDAGFSQVGLLPVPSSVNAITALVGRILVESEALQDGGGVGVLDLFYNQRSVGAVYSPLGRRLLPLDQSWRRELESRPWPTGNLPETLGDPETALRALIREYLFVSLFRACAESLASENAARLAAMQRAEKNIGELLEGLHGSFHRLRQSGIDEELFDVISGFEALGKPARGR
ncbi:MAG: F0F1 ATP synthase subunit gamma [Acidobacteria bacterium]|nr:F0F1 ATP synthase subunit gamma [Acidobacteriota bacterium]